MPLLEAREVYFFEYRNASNKRPPFDEKYFISAPLELAPTFLSLKVGAYLNSILYISSI